MKTGIKWDPNMNISQQIRPQLLFTICMSTIIIIIIILIM